MRRTRRGEGRAADKVRALLEAKGCTIDYFWFQIPAANRYGTGAKWGAEGHDQQGRHVAFFSWDTMSAVARMRNPAIDTNYSEMANHFEVFACEETA